MGVGAGTENVLAFVEAEVFAALLAIHGHQPAYHRDSYASVGKHNGAARGGRSGAAQRLSGQFGFQCGSYRPQDFWKPVFWQYGQIAQESSI